MSEAGPRRAAATPPQKAETASVPRAAPRSGELREALISRGIEILEREGPAALSMRRVARELGVSSTAPIHYFPTSAAYLAAIAAKGFQMQYEARSSSLRAKQDPAKRLLEVMLVKLQFAIDHGALFQLMYGPAIPDRRKHPELQIAALSTFRLLEVCVRDYLATRDVPEPRLEAAVYTAWTACHGVASILADGRDTWAPILRKDPLKLGRQVLQVVIAGLDAAGRRSDERDPSH